MNKNTQSELLPFICGHHQNSSQKRIKVNLATHYVCICDGCFKAQQTRIENENLLNKKGSSNTIFTFQ